MIIKHAEFVTSVGKREQIVNRTVPEIVVSGKSNCGKSSFINALCGSGGLARTSKSPGATRLINYFCAKLAEKGAVPPQERQFYLVDLPGYGFAKVSDTEKEKWSELIEAYFAEKPPIKCVMLLLDARHDPSAEDITMVNFLYQMQLPMVVVGTKIDKLNRSEIEKRRVALATAFRQVPSNIFMVSSDKKLGFGTVTQKISEILG